MRRCDARACGPGAARRLARVRKRFFSQSRARRQIPAPRCARCQRARYARAGSPRATRSAELSVGESREDLYATARYTAALLPANKPRYLMGVGTIADIITAVDCGIDRYVRVRLPHALRAQRTRNHARRRSRHPQRNLHARLRAARPGLFLVSSARPTRQ